LEELQPNLERVTHDTKKRASNGNLSLQGSLTLKARRWF
jgi:hypothetical protein